MWNCERVAANKTEVLEDVSIELQLGSEPDRIGQAPCDLIHLKTNAGEHLGTLSMQGFLSSRMKFEKDGFSVQGVLVDAAPNGAIQNWHYDTGRETWNFVVTPE